MAEEQIYGGRYYIEEPIGDGGMARVYRATDSRLGRVVALKILRDQFTNEPEFVERFRQEARLAANLAHPNIVGVYDVGEDHGQYFMVMEYVTGQNLKQVIAREAPMPIETVISFMRQLGAALDYAHSHGVIHRDIKPENILVTDRREAKVGDFGIARALAGGSLTATGTVMGSVSYLSPEQASGQPATAESDLYSAGMVLYEMLTGHVPFSGPNPVAVAMAQVNDMPASPRTFVPDLSPVVEAVVLKAIAKEQNKRFHSGYEIIAALTSPIPPAEARPRRAPPVAVAAASAPTTIAPPQMMSVAQRQKPRRGGGGALAALLSTAALLIAAILVGRNLTGGNSPASVAAGSATPTTIVPRAPTATPTLQPIVEPTLSGPATATFVVSPVTATPVDTATSLPTDTPAATATPIDTATPADTATVADTSTPAAGTDTPTAAIGTGTPTAASAGSTPSTATPSGGTVTATPGSTHGATVDLVTAKDIGPHFAPVGISTTFPAKSSVIYAVAHVHAKAKGDTVVFKWLYPDGSSFPYVNTAVAPYSGDITAYAEMFPRGPGNYTVTTTINGHQLGSVSFTVIPGAAGAATATPNS
jgi:predicted Ser/Thr protein kinase